jgi:hypothetical protein
MVLGVVGNDDLELWWSQWLLKAQFTSLIRGSSFIFVQSMMKGLFMYNYLLMPMEDISNNFFSFLFTQRYISLEILDYAIFGIKNKSEECWNGLGIISSS